MSEDKKSGAPRAERGLQAPAYFAVITSPVLDDRVLSDSAKLLYGRITSLADREGYCWSSNKALSELTGYGERTISRLVAQLEEQGHVWTESVPAPRKGGHERRIYIGRKVAEKVSSGGEASDEKGVAKIGEGSQFWRGGIDKIGEPYLKRNNKQEYNIPLNPPKGESAKRPRQHTTKYAPDWKPERFAGFWSYYPRHENPQGAVKAWDALKPSDELISTIARALEKLKASEAWRRDIGIPHAATFLNDERWRDAEGVKAAPAGGKAAPTRRLDAPGEDGGDGGWVDL